MKAGLAAGSVQHYAAAAVSPSCTIGNHGIAADVKAGWQIGYAGIHRQRAEY